MNLKNTTFKIDEGSMQMIKKSNYKLNINKVLLQIYEDVKDNIKYNKEISRF